MGKIFRVLEDYDGLIGHFENYLSNDAHGAKQSVSEALYWIGWAHARQDNIEKAFHIFIDEIQDYGNIPETSEVMLILKALEDLYQRYHQRGSSILLDHHPLLTAISFESWLMTERDSAFATGKLTYYSRFNLYLADFLEKQKRIKEAHELLVEIINIVPLEFLDAEGLGKTGLVLEQLDDPSAADRFELLLEKFPQHPQRALAYYGLARISLENDNYSIALSFIERLSNELPGHSLATESALMRRITLIRMDRADEAILHYEVILRQKTRAGEIMLERCKV